MHTAAMFRDMLFLLIATVVLWLVHVQVRVLGDGAVAVVVIMLALVMAAGSFRRARIRRAAFLHAYVAPASGLQRWWRGGALLCAGHVLFALVPALVLVVGLARLRMTEGWVLAGLAVVLLAAVWHGLARTLGAHVAARYRPEACWRLALVCCFIVLLTAFTGLYLQQAWPDFTGVSLERAVWHMVDAETARSDHLLTLLELAAAQDGFRLWLAQQLIPVLERPGLRFAAWALLLAAQALFVWAWLLWLSGVMTLVHHWTDEYASMAD